MPAEDSTPRTRLLNPVDRISEVLFGLIMAVTIVGSLSVATAGRQDARLAMGAALGCNLAWGLVDAVMFLVRTLTERSRTRTLARQVLAAADAESARHLMQQALPGELVALAGPQELEAMRQRLLAAPPPERAVLKAADYAGAFAIFLLVVVATLPVVLPFALLHDIGAAMQLSRIIALAMLFLCGAALGRHAGYPSPAHTGLAMAVFGAVLILAVIALGG
jgi:VIT1/CCC1 family predicted Fe2+/Mn2+ transporter